MTKLYVFSGLGADKRIFAKLDLSNFELVHVEWIEPLKNESLQAYAQRIGKDIPEYASVLGVSFGGMLATEIALKKSTRQLYLISTAKTKYEIPLFYRCIGQIGIVSLVPSSVLKKANSITYWFFGMKTPEEKALLRRILYDTDPKFLKWAMNAICKWENNHVPQNYIHLHGSKDRILPFRKVIGAKKIDKGGHLMVYSLSQQIQFEPKIV